MGDELVHGLLGDLGPSRDGSEAAAADPCRLAAIEQAALAPNQFDREHHELERYFVSTS
jgi:hypothetical protein